MSKEPTIKEFHKESDRHVLTIETDMTEQQKRQIFHDSELLRIAGNELTTIMKYRLDQLMQTKVYRGLKKAYGKAVKSGNDKKRREVASQMNQMIVDYGITWEFCRQSMIPICKKYGLHSTLGITKAEDVWTGVEMCLYGNGSHLHFSKRGNFSTMRAKWFNRCIIIKTVNDKLILKYGDTTFGLIEKDKFHNDEVSAVVEYLKNSEAIDRYALDMLIHQGVCIDTYRPCYVTLVPKMIRGKLRVFAHITIEGKAKQKFDRFGCPRHRYGTGMVGCDVGTQTFAYTSETEVQLKNLAERGRSIETNERKERLIYRAMDRSRRATNPDNYNEDGTVKKGKKVWVYSNRYKEMKVEHTELCRINAVNRKLAIREDVNHIRSLGDVFVTEPKNADKLKRRVKETTINENGKYNRKKRFGHSIQNRCPGYFQEQVKQKFESTGGEYIEVPYRYRASKYDHTADDYIDKTLNDRMYHLFDGTEIQRDWYSSLLLYCYDRETNNINKQKCNEQFESQYQKELALIEWIKENNIDVKNSGIRVNKKRKHKNKK